MSDELYPKPDQVYVRRGRCVYCGSKKIKIKYGYEWCDKTCSPGALGLDIYEREHHLGPYAPDNPAEETNEGSGA